MDYQLLHNLELIFTGELPAAVSRAFELCDELSTAAAGTGLFVVQYPLEYLAPAYGRVLNEVHLAALARPGGTVRLLLEDGAKAKYAIIDLRGPQAAVPRPTESDRAVALNQLVGGFLPARPDWVPPVVEP